MKANPDEMRRFYADLSDEALQSVDESELTAQARLCYEAELAKRKLPLPPTSESPGEIPELPFPEGQDLLTVATYVYLGEGLLARSLLQSEGIAAHLDNEYGGVRTGGLNSLRLMVPASSAAQARDILAARPPKADLSGDTEVGWDEQP